MVYQKDINIDGVTITYVNKIGIDGINETTYLVAEHPNGKTYRIVEWVELKKCFEYAEQFDYLSLRIAMLLKWIKDNHE